MPGCPLRNTFVQPAWLTGRPRSTSTTRRPSSRPGSWWDRVSPVGAGLLAKAVCQFAVMLDVLASSRASSLPQVLRCTWILCLPKIQCGSEPARDSGLTADLVFPGGPNPSVGAGLPAKKAAHPTLMQADPPLSRASFAPTGICSGRKSVDRHRLSVGASLLAKTAAHPTLMQADPLLSRASSLPQGFTVAANL